MRPQPRRLAPLTPFSEALPRLLPPLPPQGPEPREVGGVRRGGTESLDVTAEPLTDPTLSQTSLSSPKEPLPSSQPFMATGPQPLPPSHPLRERSIREEILSMRQQLRKYLQLKIQQK